MSNNQGFWVTATNNQGLVVYTRWIEAQSHAEAHDKALEELARTDTPWAALWADNMTQVEAIVRNRESC